MKFRYSLLTAALCCGLLTQQTRANDNFAVRYQQQVAPFWQAVQPRQLSLPDGTTLPYVLIKPAQFKATVVVVNGRTESYMKYQELAYELTQQGFRVLMFDHRGQGLSARLTDNPHKGHINNFQQYVDDMHQLISNVLLADQGKQPLYLLGHSMGGRYQYLVSGTTS